MRKPVYLVLTAFIVSCLVVGTPSNDSAASATVTLQGPPQVQSSPPLRPKTPAKIVQKVQPTYPAEARTKGVQGTVVLRVVVDKAGEPDTVDVISGDPLLTPAAVDAVRQWRWEPVLIDKKPVTVATKITVNFKLDNNKNKEE